MSVRQLFYQMVVRGHVEKTQHAYKRVADATVAMRRTKRLPYSKIDDGGRVRRRLPGWESIGDLLEQAERQFRLDHWGHQPELVEIWCEKLGLTGVITPVTDEYGVTFVPLGGFGSAVGAGHGRLLHATVRTATLPEGDHADQPRLIRDGTSCTSLAVFRQDSVHRQ